jgi:hypothetical protein
MTLTLERPSLPTLALATAVDAERRQILGFVVATKGDAAGHGECLDDESLAQIVALGNSGAAADTGAMRARLNHPNGPNPRSIECPLEQMLGFPRNFRLDGDKVRADLQLLSPLAAPAGDQLLALATEAPWLLGASLVFDVQDPAAHEKARKAGKNPSVRFASIYALDFVDLPATNPQGLFAAGKDPTNGDKKMAKLKAYVRNGGLFASVGGDESEIEMPEEYTCKHCTKAAADGEDGAKKKHAAEPADPQTHAAQLEAARTDAVKAERVYRSEFDTAAAAAGLTGEPLTKFHSAFYGRPIEDVKFLAASAIGGRAKAVGEGGGGDVAKTDAEKAAEADSAITEACAKRFAADGDLRALWGVQVSQPENPAYKAGLARFTAQAQRPEYRTVATV